MRNRRDRQKEQRLQSLGCKAEYALENRQLVPVPKANITLHRVDVSPPIAKPNIIVLGAITLACLLEVVGLGINGWFAWYRGTTLEQRILMASLGFILEAMVFVLPVLACILWQGRRWLFSGVTSILCIPLFVFAAYNSLGFASFYLTEATTVRAERITPLIVDAQRRLDTLTGSRYAECLKRGDKCRQLEKDEQSAIESLRLERDKVSLVADPQKAAAAKLIAWVSPYHPSSDDFANLWLLFLTILPQLGGLVLMLSTASRT